MLAETMASFAEFFLNSHLKKKRGFRFIVLEWHGSDRGMPPAWLHSEQSVELLHVPGTIYSTTPSRWWIKWDD